MSGGQQKGKGGGAKKIGRNRIFCLRYFTEGRRLKNKVRKLRKYCRYNPNDQRAKSALTRLT